jgi:hypothetical protein
MLRFAQEGQRRAESGQALILIALSMVMLIGFTGLAIDVGIVMSAHRELTRLTDSASLAAAGALSGVGVDDATRKTRAEQRANEYALMHGFDRTAAGNGLVVSFPGNLGSRKIVQIDSTERVPLTFMRLLGFNDVPISCNGRQAEAAAVDVVILQDLSISQVIWSHKMQDSSMLVNPNYHTGDSSYRDPFPGGIYPAGAECNPTKPADFSNCGWWNDNGFAYDPTQATTNFDWPPKKHLVPADPPRTNRPWDPFYKEQDAARYFISKLDVRYDKVGLASFSSSGTINKKLSSNLNDVATAVGFSPAQVGQKGWWGLVPGGSTNMADGIIAAVNAVTDTSVAGGARETAIGAIIMITDGSATVRRGNTGADAGCDSQHLSNCSVPRQNTMEEAQKAADKGVVIYSIFVGSDEWETDNGLLMQYVSDITDNRKLDGTYSLPAGYGPAYAPGSVPTNNYFHARDQNELQAAYDTILGRIYTRLLN